MSKDAFPQVEVLQWTKAYRFMVTYKPCNHELVIWEGWDSEEEKPMEIANIPAACPFCGPAMRETNS